MVKHKRPRVCKNKTWLPNKMTYAMQTARTPGRFRDLHVRKNFQEKQKKRKSSFRKKEKCNSTISTGIVPLKEQPARRRLEEPAAFSVRPVRQMLQEVYKEVFPGPQLKLPLSLSSLKITSSSQLSWLCKEIEYEDCTCFSKHGWFDQAYSDAARPIPGFFQGKSEWIWQAFFFFFFFFFTDLLSSACKG